mmetsp:Transcript_33611/g.105297  ORF Transcript_33611/g.105297 Transcript_33611/m.105297 type:complete len:243 (+) Transcript_33611:328-1056(+)
MPEQAGHGTASCERTERQWRDLGADGGASWGGARVHPRRRSRGLLLCLLRRRLHKTLPRGMLPRVCQLPDEKECSPWSQGGPPVRACHGRGDRSLGRPGPSLRLGLLPERRYHDKLAAVVSDNRPAVAGHCLDQEQGGGARSPDHADGARKDAEHLRGVLGPGQVGAHREHGRDDRCGAGPHSLSQHHQAGQQARCEAWRQGDHPAGLVQAFYADEAVQPALPTRGASGDHGHQLHSDHGRA